MRALLVASLLIVGVAVALPSVFTNYMTAKSGQHSTAAAAVSSSEPSKSHEVSREVEIRAERDGHFYVNATVNFRPVRLMVDTGATVVALRVSDAAAAGIRLREADFTNPVQTANGTTNAAQATLDSVSVSDIEVHNVRALIIPDDQLAVSLLGGSFLHELRRFEVADGTLIFED